MVQIGSWVIHTACRQLRAWIDAGLPPIRMALNLSHCQLTRGNLIEIVGHALRESRLEPPLLELEISERGVLRRTPEILQLLNELKALGVRLSIDDFGTGESAISYLKSLPVDVLKIDRSYISGASTSHSDAAIASAIVAMAHRLDLRVVAEGIESQEQILFARNWGCDEFQGYLFSRPAPPDDFAALLARTASLAELEPAEGSAPDAEEGFDRDPDVHDTASDPGGQRDV
jgi:EAL domain-containing protein (putative c-di-GMP-specific phosphodiesterase class I)